ncbi:MAG: FecR family protein [Candidatus Cryptobacteroides sp.]
MIRTDEERELKLLSHAIRHHLSENTGVEESLAALNREIDAAQRKRRFRRISVVLCSAAAAVAAVVTAGILTFRSIPALDYRNGGETAMNVVLPDGTQVWMNPGASLSVGNKFNKAERDVRLEGEAYFDVAHDAQRPFVVTADGFRVKVLGTVFNVKSIPGEQIAEVTLAQGSVMMQSASGMNLVRLKPGQQAVLDAESSALEIKSVAVGDMLLRHYGAVSLHHASVSEILAKISEVYGKTIVQISASDESTYNFSFQKESGLDEVLSMLRFICPELELSVRD